MDHLQDRSLSIKEICANLGVNDDTVNRWIKFRDKPTHKKERLWKFKINEIDKWVKACGANLKAI
ncbi:MAG: helix-turn-helix domain-containing protein [Candidatus Cloacimonetes bacterium]|nr:helix-turn-helix domain-containing protein [Candidatus Cloacimonadota bacterium]